MIIPSEQEKLLRKLGLQPVHEAYTLYAPASYTQLLPIVEPAAAINDLPDGLAWIQAFYTHKTSLVRDIANLKKNWQRMVSFGFPGPRKNQADNQTCPTPSYARSASQVAL
jgi:hypothetical protein